LIVYGAPVGPEGLIAFAHGGGMPRLQILRLNNLAGGNKSDASAAVREFRQRRPGVQLFLI
jgi:hypothetical protein